MVNGRLFQVESDSERNSGPGGGAEFLNMTGFPVMEGARLSVSPKGMQGMTCGAMTGKGTPCKLRTFIFV